MRWRLEAVGCAVAGALTGVALTIGAVLRQERRTAANIRAEAYAPELDLDDRRMAHQ